MGTALCYGIRRGEKVTDNEIIKALKRCINGTGKCNLCPMFEKCKTDINALEKHTLDLINRQNEEIGRLLKAIEDKHCVYEKRVVTEAIKEFEKKFEKKIKDVQFTLGQTWEIQNALKDTREEMVGDAE